jgi:transposase-like protein
VVRDATYEKIREGGQLVSQAAVVAVGARNSEERRVLGLAVGQGD